MASKYAPLQRYLEQAAGSRLRLSFRDVEAILQFALPKSARTYAPWWANVGGSHVQAEAWMDAGWRTCNVDVPGERVSFERASTGAPDATEARPPSPVAAVAEIGAPFLPADLAIDLGRLSPGAARLLGEYLGETDADVTAAVSRALEDAALTRRRRLIERFAAASPFVAGDSA